MFEYLKMNMRSDGTENCTAYAKFALDSRGIWFGESYDLVNNHVKNSYEIQLFNSHGYIKTVLGKKEETLNLNEFKKNNQLIKEIDHYEYIKSHFLGC